ncbi:putative serine/threonine-protein kinase [Hibiscus syriacus]|uniref:Serine/threonine-protein kinase n=1 Tax=Hibiscus syriacus TaxID=106335 RepID=A0A6A2ZIX4_HIBSY|nr:putative serine/threonine-protein kinase [Hibiscus syriacus]
MGCMFSQEPQGENADEKDNEKDGEKKNNDANGEKGDGSNAEGDKEGVSGGWPSWLASVAGEAVAGWLPRKSESFEKLEKIEQGTYISVYKARDLETDKIVAMKKLECIVTSRMSSSLYLVFEYMEHDLAGLAATPGITLTEPQIKCFMQQLFRGVEHCHTQGVLHRDLKGSNLLINDNGILKIADFGLVAIDLWSAGCILAELFFGKPIMPGRAEIEFQKPIRKWSKCIRSLCSVVHPRRSIGRKQNFPMQLALNPSNLTSADLMRRSKTSLSLPCLLLINSFQWNRNIEDILIQYLAVRKRAEAVKNRGAETIRSGSMDFKGVRTPEFIAQGQSKTRIARIESGAAGFWIDPHKVALQNGLSQYTSMIHPSAAATWNKAGPTLKESIMPQETKASDRKEDKTSNNDHVSSFVTRKNMFHCSGPLMPPGGNIDDILKEHEKQMKQALLPCGKLAGCFLEIGLLQVQACLTVITAKSKVQPS